MGKIANRQGQCDRGPAKASGDDYSSAANSSTVRPASRMMAERAFGEFLVTRNG